MISGESNNQHYHHDGVVDVQEYLEKKFYHDFSPFFNLNGFNLISNLNL